MKFTTYLYYYCSLASKAALTYPVNPPHQTKLLFKQQRGIESAALRAMKTALITGCSDGIGKDVAKEFHKRGLAHTPFFSIYFVSNQRHR
jgi:hypothetical protein